MTLDKLIEQFERSISLERNLSLHTQRNYLSDLNQFQQFLRSQYPQISVTEIDSTAIRSYLGFLYKKNKQRKCLTIEKPPCHNRKKPFYKT